MDPKGFDNLARALASRYSRRAAAKIGAVGLCGGLLGAARTIDAQEATPPTSESSPKPEFLFVQTFDSGTWNAKPDGEDVHELVLSGHLDQTNYFSDRPNPDAGVAPTDQFLAGLSFSPANPPNAAVVVRSEEREDVLVVELLEPRISRSFGDVEATTLSYEARVLADYAVDGFGNLFGRQTDATLPQSLRAGTLFIDDCPDIVYCLRWIKRGPRSMGPVPGGPYGQCWDWSSFNCNPCAGMSQQEFSNLCNGAYPECENDWCVDIGI